jgi:hypothetical protein
MNELLKIAAVTNSRDEIMNSPTTKSAIPEKKIKLINISL